MENIAITILTHLKSVSQKYGHEASVHEHQSAIGPDISYMIASKQDKDATQQLIWTIPVTNPNLVKVTCIQVFTTNGTQPHSTITMYDLDIIKPDFFSSAEDIFKLYESIRVP